ncbi:hypothetical protein COCON_G00051310 [Conger conger]|uniref:Cyclin-like domain-containing protein n=1 Tax=Conger conger TaxID=82655 RepID=A0A9Q1I3U6_CONCO|nr:cyclin-T2a isoform X2 [Conger conger]KAJ8282612.1 hypothetical protein COCON_G00051310 [Conger conger]
MAACRGSASRWFFTREQVENTPSRACGVEPDRELSYRQQAANLIQDMGQRLNVSQLTINTAIVYMHRFYMFNSFTRFHRNIISPTTLFLAAKVEEQPRKLEHVIKVAHACLNPQEAPLDTKSNAYLQQAQELVLLETIVLQTLGFEITIEHPHTDVVKCSQLVRASKDLAQTSYFMATNSLHLTTFCLQHKPTVIACVCIHLACKWSNWEIPVSTDGKHWWEYVDPSVTLELLDELTHEFLQILEKTPSRLKRIRNWRATQAAKKPKGDGQGLDTSYPGSSLLQGPSLVDGIPGVSGSATFPKSSASFPVMLPSSAAGALSLDSVASMQGAAFTFTASGDWPQEAFSLKADPLSIHQGALPSNAGDFTPGKHEHKPGGGAKHQPPLYPSPVAPSQKLSLDKYREKHAAELAGQKRRQEQSQEADAYAPSALLEQPYHRKHTQLQGSDKHPSEKREKGASLKLRLPVPPPEKAAGSKEELKMKIKVSSDEGGAKSRHSASPLVGKEKHRDHSHRHHKHAHGHAHPQSGNGQAAGGVPFRAPAAVAGGDAAVPASGSSRKRAHPDGTHNHHHSKSSKSGKSAGGLRTSQHPSETGQEVEGQPRPRR